MINLKRKIPTTLFVFIAISPIIFFGISAVVSTIKGCDGGCDYFSPFGVFVIISIYYLMYVVAPISTVWFIVRLIRKNKNFK